MRQRETGSLRFDVTGEDPLTQRGAQRVAFGILERRMVTGETSSRYRIVDRIAEGGMGEVYLAQMETIDGVEKRVALKLVRSHLARNSEFASLFIDEAKLAMSLSHGNVVHSFDVGRMDDRLFLAMEYVEGLTLGELIAGYRELFGELLPHRLVVYIAVEVLKGLSYAHRRKDVAGGILNIVHRDVSPGNILISSEGEVKVADFGIAKSALHTRKATEGRVKGKLPYVAPEQLRETGVDARTDLYALGAVMYEMLTDRWLVDPVEPDDAIASILKGGHASPVVTHPQVPDALAKIVMRAITVNPEDRFPNATTMLDALERFALAEGYLLSSSELANSVEEIVAAKGSTATGAAVGSSHNGASKSSNAPRVSAEPFNALLGRELRKLDTSDAYSVFTTDEVQGLFPVAARQTADVVAAPPAAPAPTSRSQGWRWIGAVAVLLLLGVGWARWSATNEVATSGSGDDARSSTDTRAEQRAANGVSAAASQGRASIQNPSERSVTADTAKRGDAEGTAMARSNAAGTSTTDPSERGKTDGTSRTDSSERGNRDSTSTDQPAERRAIERKDTQHRKNRRANRATQAAPGYLSINSDPWAYVSIDGKRIKTTPVIRHELKPGRHTVTLSNPEAGLERTLGVKIKSGGNRRLRVNLREGS